MDFENLHLNTIVAALMELFNELSAFETGRYATLPTRLRCASFGVVSADAGAILTHTPPRRCCNHLGHAGGLLSAGRWPQADAE